MVKILFAGTPMAAVPTLRALWASDHEVVGVLTRPPARQGRSGKLVPSPVALLATELGLPLIESSRPDGPEVIEEISGLEPDLGVVVAYGAILRPAVLQIPPHGWINLHFSDLPRWRGAAPVQHALRAGDPEIATCVFQLEEGLDTGPIFSRRVFPLNGRETTGELLEYLAKEGADQVVEVADQIDTGEAEAKPQSRDGVCVARSLTKEDAFVSFDESAAAVDAQIRALTPAPGAWTLLPNGTNLKLGPVELTAPDGDASGLPGEVYATKRAIFVKCQEGWVRLGEVGPVGKRTMSATDWWRGARLAAGTRLGGDRG